VTERVVALTLAAPPGETTHWAAAAMAKACAVKACAVMSQKCHVGLQQPGKGVRLLAVPLGDAVVLRYRQ